MAQIHIIGIDPANENNLLLEVDSRPNPGKSFVKRNEQVQWEIKGTLEVEAIEGITMKTISGNDNIFRLNPPKPDAGDKKKWKAKVDSNAPDWSDYIYNIVWKKRGESNTRTFDPILSIRPIKVTEDTSLMSASTLITAAAVTLCIILGVLLYQSKKEIRQLKQPVQITVPVK